MDDNDEIAHITTDVAANNDYRERLSDIVKTIDAKDLEPAERQALRLLITVVMHDMIDPNLIKQRELELNKAVNKILQRLKRLENRTDWLAIVFAGFKNWKTIAISFGVMIVVLGEDAVFRILETLGIAQ